MQKDEEEHSYEKLYKKEVSLTSTLLFFLEELLKKVKRVLTPRGKRKISVEATVPSEIIWHWFYAIRDFKLYRIDTTDVKFIPKKHHRGFTEYSGCLFTFYSIGAINCHIKKIIGHSIYNSFSRSLRQGGTAKTTVSEQFPETMLYNISRGKLIFKANYNLINRYGVLC